MITNTIIIKNLEICITNEHINAVNFIKTKYKITPSLIGFHGQTIFHDMNKKISIQLGDGNTDGIVELTVQLSYKNWRSSANRGKPFGFNASGILGSSAVAGAVARVLR